MTRSPDTRTNPPHLYHPTPLTCRVYEDKTTVPTPPTSPFSVYRVYFLLSPFNKEGFLASSETLVFIVVHYRTAAHLFVQIQSKAAVI